MCVCVCERERERERERECEYVCVRERMCLCVCAPVYLSCFARIATAATRKRKRLKILPEFGRDPVARGGSGARGGSAKALSPPRTRALRRNIRRFFKNACFSGVCGVFRALACARQTARESGVSATKSPKQREHGVQAGTSGGARKPLAARPNLQKICS